MMSAVVLRCTCIVNSKLTIEVGLQLSTTSYNKSEPVLGHNKNITMYGMYVKASVKANK